MKAWLLFKALPVLKKVLKFLRIAKCDMCERWTILTITQSTPVGVKHYCAACLQDRGLRD